MRTLRCGDRPRALASGGAGDPAPRLRLPPLLPRLHAEGSQRRTVPLRAGALPARPGLRPHAGPVGRPADPGGHGLLLLQLRHGEVGGLLPGAGRRHGVAPGPRLLGGDAGDEPAVRLHRGRRRGAAGATVRGHVRVLPGPDRRLLRARRVGAPPLEGLRRRRGSARRPSPNSSTGSASRAGRSRFPRRRRDRTRLRLRRRPGRTLGRRPHDDVPPEGGGDGRRGRARHRPAVPDPHRAGQAALLRRRRRAPLRPLRGTGPLGRHDEAAAAGLRRPDGAELLRQHGDRAAGAVHLRLRGGDVEVLPRPGGRRRPAPPAVLRHHLREERRGVPGGAGALAQGVGLPSPGGHLAGDDGHPLPQQRLGARPARHPRRPQPVPVGTGPERLGRRRSSALLGEGAPR